MLDGGTRCGGPPETLRYGPMLFGRSQRRAALPVSPFQGRSLGVDRFFRAN